MGLSKSEFPEAFTALLDKEQTYTEGGKVKMVGIAKSLRWSMAQITTMDKNRIPTKFYYGIEVLIKPNDGSRARWTRPMNSGIEVEKD